jgi:hypothetical protein
MSEPVLALPKCDPARIARDYAPQFEASEQFLDAVWTAIPFRGADTFDVFLMNVLGRGISTYRALLHLLAAGCHDHAKLLSRSLFEDMIVAYWFALPENRDSAVARVQGTLDSTYARLDRLVTESGETL